MKWLVNWKIPFRMFPMVSSEQCMILCELHKGLTLTTIPIADIPLNSFQAQYNEGLMTMYSGYHPDAFWEVEVLDYDVEKLKTGSQEDIPEEPMPIQSVVSVKEEEPISVGSSGDKAAPS